MDVWGVCVHVCAYEGRYTPVKSGGVRSCGRGVWA